MGYTRVLHVRHERPRVKRALQEEPSSVAQHARWRGGDIVPQVLCTQGTSWPSTRACSGMVCRIWTEDKDLTGLPSQVLWHLSRMLGKSSLSKKGSGCLAKALVPRIRYSWLVQFRQPGQTSGFLDQGKRCADRLRGRTSSVDTWKGERSHYYNRH